MKLDADEQELLELLEKDQLQLKIPSPQQKKSVAQMAENTFKKDKRVTLRLYEHDFKGIQKKALEEGVPYQTLISSLIHRYVEGELVSKKA